MTHPYTPVTVCGTCFKPQSDAAHQVQSGKLVKSYWVHWDSVVKNDAAGLAIVQREAARRSTFLLNQWDAWMIGFAKAVNPNLVVLVYKDASSTRTTGAPFPLGPTGVDYKTAPELWFLHDSSGNRMQYEGYPGHWRMNVNVTGYMYWWASQVHSDVKAGGFDGVFIDNLLFSRTQYGPAPREYSTDTAFRQGYLNFLSVVRTELPELVVYGNLSNARLTTGAWESYLDKLDGAWDEWWLTFGDQDRLPEYDVGWSRQVAEIKYAESHGKVALVQPHFSTKGAAFRYSLASYLVASTGGSQYAYASTTDGYGTPSAWQPEYDWDLGSPLGESTSTSTATYKRRFEKGLVLVNARSSDTVSFNLGGTYLNASGQVITSLAVAGRDGAILRKV